MKVTAQKLDIHYFHVQCGKVQQALCRDLTDKAVSNSMPQEMLIKKKKKGALHGNHRPVKP